MGLSSYGLQSTSLEEVFLYLASHAAEATDENQQSDARSRASVYSLNAPGETLLGASVISSELLDERLPEFSEGYYFTYTAYKHFLTSLLGLFCRGFS